jgi:hypothetical protein
MHRPIGWQGRAKVPIAAGSGYFIRRTVDRHRTSENMRSSLTAAAAALLLALLAGCGAQPEGGGSHPNLIIVRDFAVSPGVVTLDPSFGFSLHRGSPGVPPTQRAASVGRAAAFSVADAAAQQLAGLGYDVARSNTATAEAGGRALIVTGAFRHIDEGRRRQVGAENARIAVDVEIDYQGGSAAPMRMMSFPVDSQRTAGDGMGGAGRRGANISAAADRVGRIVAKTASDLARLNQWPAKGH